MKDVAKVEANKVTILCNEAAEASSIDLKTAQDSLEKITLLIDEATNKIKQLTLDFKQ